MPRRRKVSRLVTHRLAVEQLPKQVQRLAALIAKSEMNLCHVAEAVQAQPRAVRRWVRVATDRGFDVLEMARELLRVRGVDPAALPAERIREGMEAGREKRVSDRSDTRRKGRVRSQTGRRVSPGRRKVNPASPRTPST